MFNDEWDPRDDTSGGLGSTLAIERGGAKLLFGRGSIAGVEQD